MSLRKTTRMIKLFLSIALLAGITIAGKWAEPNAAPSRCSEIVDRGSNAPCQPCMRVVAGSTITSCAAPSDEEPSADLPSDKSAASARSVKVSSLVERALQDQKRMLTERLVELRRWDADDSARFAAWFGATSQEARRTVQIRVLRVLELNKNYSVANFRRGKHRAGVYAYVFPTEPSKIYLDDEFVKQFAVGQDSRVCTITHEMSHFNIIGGTKDHKYGIEQCKALALENVEKALNNADNFGFWAEGTR